MQVTFCCPHPSCGTALVGILPFRNPTTLPKTSNVPSIADGLRAQALHQLIVWSFVSPWAGLTVKMGEKKEADILALTLDCSPSEGSSGRKPGNLCWEGMLPGPRMTSFVLRGPNQSWVKSSRKQIFNTLIFSCSWIVHGHLTCIPYLNHNWRARPDMVLFFWE